MALSLLIGSALAGALGNSVGIVALLSIQAVSYPLAGLITLLALAPVATKLPDRTQAETGS